jgi:hypothetical protein
MKKYFSPEMETIEMATCSVIAESERTDAKTQQGADTSASSVSAQRDDMWKYME